MSGLWEGRSRRAEILEREWPFSAHLLRFFRPVFALQGEVHRAVAEVGRPARDPIRSDLLVPFLPRLFDLVEEHGSPYLRERVGSMRKYPAEVWDRFFRDYWNHGRREGVKAPEVFFLRAMLEPYLNGDGRARRKTRAPRGDCPSCGCAAVAGVLREDREAQAVTRSLLCSLCSEEWSFPRVLCPGCREEKPEKLPRFTAAEIPWVRVEACDTCRRYLKAVDLSQKPEAEPLVDELGSTPLDVVARERGYEKLAANLAGV